MDTARHLHQVLIQTCRRNCQVSQTAQSAKWIKHILTRVYKAFRILILTKTSVLFSGHKMRGTVTWPPRINIVHIRIQIDKNQTPKVVYVLLQATRMCTTRSKDQARAQLWPTTQVGKVHFEASWLNRESTIFSSSWPKTSPRATWLNSLRRFSNNKTFWATWSNRSRSMGTVVHQLCQRRSPKCWVGRNMDQTRALIAHLKTSPRVVVTMGTL